MNKNLHYILLLFSSVFSYGQVTVLLDSDLKEVKVNNRVVLTIVQEISGEHMEQESPLKLPDLSKFEIIGRASEQNTIIDEKKGVRINQIIYQVVVEAKQAGKIKIGSALVQVNGKMYKSEPFEILVKDTDKKINNTEESLAKDIYLNLEIEDDNIYENQPTIAILRAYSRNFDNFRKVENIKVPAQKNVNFHLISYPKQDIEPATNSSLASQVIAVFVIFPKRAGNIELEPISASFNSSEDNKIISNKVKLNVKNLPKGSPLDFTNAVGKFNIEIENPNPENHIELFKPTNVLVKISGIGNFESLKFPKIIESENYTLYQPKISKNLVTDKNGLVGQISAEYILIPKKTGNIPVNLEAFSFFNPSQNKYVDLGVKSLIINVLNKEQIADAKSTLDVVNEYTKNVISVVNLSGLESENQKYLKKKGFNWLFAFGSLGTIIGFGLLLFLLKNKRKNTKKSSAKNENKPISNVTETEEIIKQKFSTDKETYFKYLENLKDKNEIEQFFSTYDELQKEAKNQLVVDDKISLVNHIEQIKGTKFAEELRHLQQEIQIEKYAPIHIKEHLDELYITIVIIYSEIMK